MTFGEKYASGSLVLQIIALSFFIRALMGPNRKSLEAFGRSKLIMWTNIFAAIFNLGLNYLLVSREGILGAAAATLLTWASVDFIYSYSIYTEREIHPFSVSIYKPLAGYTLVLAAIGTVVKRVYPNSLIGIVIFIFIGGLVYPFIIAYFGGIEQQDIMIVNSIEERFSINTGPIKKHIRKFM